MGGGEGQQRNQHRTPARVSPGGRDHAFWTKACERVGGTDSAPRFGSDADDEEINTTIAAMKNLLRFLDANPGIREQEGNARGAGWCLLSLAGKRCREPYGETCPGQCASTVRGVAEHQRQWRWSSGERVLITHPCPTDEGWQRGLRCDLAEVGAKLPAVAKNRIDVFVGVPEDDWYYPGRTMTVLFQPTAAPPPRGLVPYRWTGEVGAREEATERWPPRRTPAAKATIDDNGRRIWPAITYGGLPVEGEYVGEAEERLLLSEPDGGKYRYLGPFEARKQRDAYKAGLLFKALRLVGTSDEEEPRNDNERKMLRVARRTTIPLPSQYWTDLGGDPAMYRHGKASAGVKLSACYAVASANKAGLGRRSTFWISRTNRVVVAAWGTPLEGAWLDAAITALSADVTNPATLCR